MRNAVRDVGLLGTDDKQWANQSKRLRLHSLILQDGQSRHTLKAGEGVSQSSDAECRRGHILP